MNSQKVKFAFMFLILAMLACSIPGQSAEVAPPTTEPTTVVYVVIEPTATATIAVTETPAFTLTPTLPPEVTLLKNSNCRIGPSEFYYIADQISKDKVLPVVGRNEDGSWWQVINATNRECWIFNENTQANSDFTAVPIKEAPVLPDVPGNFFVTDQSCQPGPKIFEVAFSWAAGANTDGFRLYRNGSRIIELKASKFNFRDKNAPLKVNLSYELEAFNKNGTSQKAVQIVPACN